LEDLIKAMKALSDETRLRILYLILQRECCVCEVTQALNISQTRASRNLTILHEAGFTKLRKEGLWSHYSIDKNSMESWRLPLLEALSRGLTDNPVIREDLVNLGKALKISREC
jgi:ArsR family transcriptional regulator, arsenate/arsenite/antimonite-responsive transcriptional repressor